VEELVRAACSWVTLGGAGCRSRKGWGALEGGLKAASTEGLLSRGKRIWQEQRQHVLASGDPLPGRAPDFPQLLYRKVFLDTGVHDRWELALGSIGKRYKESLLQKDTRWIAGSASPRRASSIFLTLARLDGKLRGVITFLPCRRGADSEGAAHLKEMGRVFDRLGTRTGP
jgi:hypothetical protein